ncbi:RNA-guided endonuclease InsQ/TnpB family protein [Halegenticoccus soli]|uniref:RNA-guided endonuclease InsQ/TnpB family protein n=1 Tax=Halegenticoccus soli TaxID=1985678 RepID=UPI000C6D4D6E|nr:RNA-guided endonuclease TnpB family protein [Halegenticoccus soli]
MYYAYKYRFKPPDAHREELDRHRDICRQLYNHALYRFNQIADDVGTVKQRVRSVRDELPDLKQWWDDLPTVYSTVLQTTVMPIADSVNALGKFKQNGYGVGQLKWKPPREFHSFTYSQSGFKLDKKGGRTLLSLSKLGDIPIRLHRTIPDNATLKQVTLKKEPTGEWFATFGVELDREPPTKPENPERCVGIDVGILTYAHDTSGTAVGSLDLSSERERLEREQRKLSRKQHGSAIYEKQRRRVAECHADLRRKRRDFLHKLSTYYAWEYDLVAVEDLNVAGMMQFNSNSRNRVSAAWGTFLRMLEYKCEREGTHFIPVNPRNTTKECAACGVKSDKPLWIREHSCPTCGFTADRDWNGAWNILRRGIKKVGAGRSESPSSESHRDSDRLRKSWNDFRTPVEAALPTGTIVVPAQRVVEAGSPTLKRERKRASRVG